MSSNKAGKKRANPRDEDEAMLDSQFAAADSSDEEDDDEDEDDEEESSDDGEEIVEGDEGEEEGEEPTAMDGCNGIFSHGTPAQLSIVTATAGSKGRKQKMEDVTITVDWLDAPAGASAARRVRKDLYRSSAAASCTASGASLSPSSAASLCTSTIETRRARTISSPVRSPGCRLATSGPTTSRSRAAIPWCSA